MEASKRNRENDGDGISFEVDEDLEELSCSLMAKEGDGRLVACSFADLAWSFISDG